MHGPTCIFWAGLRPCPLQGVGDLYTDPTIHTMRGDQGEGDFSADGMECFLATHTPGG